MRPFLSLRVIYRALLGIIIFATLLIQFVYGFSAAPNIGVYVEQFFSYFTILTNLFVATLFLYEAATPNKTHSTSFESLRGAAVFCAVLTGVTYALFLKGPHGMGEIAYSVSWINIVFHYLMPAAVFLEWLLFPPVYRMNWSTLFTWIGITIPYAVLVELGGLYSHVYPYFFLDPVRLGGYAHVFRASAGWLPFFLVFGVAIIGSANLQEWIRTRKK